MNSQIYYAHVRSIVGILVCLFFFGIQNSAHAFSWSGSDVDLSGWAWSSNIGWISFNCTTGSAVGGDICFSSNYGVSIDNADGKLRGHAWSSNIGWIQFSDNGNGCPSGSGCDAEVIEDAGDIELRGWARALSHGGGWDGWISLSCENMSDCGTLNYFTVFGNGVMSGNSFAWGSFVVGWIDLHSIQFATPCGNTTYCSGNDFVTEDSWCRILNTETCTVECDTGPPVSCTVLTPVSNSFKSDSTLVRIGESVDVDVDVANVDYCIVLTLEGDSSLLSGGGFPDYQVDTTWESPALQGATTFILSCVPAGGGVLAELDRFTVYIVPNSIEI